MVTRRWRVRTAPEVLDPALESHVGTAGRLGAILLHARGIRDGLSAAQFLSPSLDHLSDPFSLPDMTAAVERIAGAVKRGERIGVLGDFDVDGLTGAAILVDTLTGLNARVEVHIPDRAADGHGLTMGTIDTFRATGVTVVVTADTGSTALAEIAYAASLGIDTVVTDHHLFEDRPPTARAVVNPNQPGTPAHSATLSGSGVAFRLAQALGQAFERETPQRLVALAALGTIADVAPLTGDNRAITSAGLRELEQTTHPGLRSLMAAARNGNRGARGPVDTETVAFHVAPRLNAPGRLGSPLLSLRLLTTQDQAEAEAIAAEIESLNTERQRLSRGAWAIAESQVNRLTELPPLVAIVSSALTPGLLGPLAGRLCSEFERPAVAVHVEGGIARASARSTPSFDIHAAVAVHASMLHRFGGHARAAGFTCDEKYLDAVLGGMSKLASTGAGPAVTPCVNADVEVALGDLGAGLWTFVQMMAPFGEGNPAPLFFTRGMLPMQVRTLGSGGDHLRLSLDGGARRFDAIGFGLGAANLGSGMVDAIYVLRSDRWNGRSRNELELKAIRPTVPSSGVGDVR